MTRTIRATVPADLVDKIGKAEGLVRGDKETRLSFQRRCLALYDVRADRTAYVATRKDQAASEA